MESGRYQNASEVLRKVSAFSSGRRLRTPPNLRPCVRLSTTVGRIWPREGSTTSAMPTWTTSSGNSASAPRRPDPAADGEVPATLTPLLPYLTHWKHPAKLAARQTPHHEAQVRRVGSNPGS